MKPLRLQFYRTRCDCPPCSEHCRHMPGALAPGDLQMIRDYLNAEIGLTAAEVDDYFSASPGALVIYQGAPRRIGTIVPRRRPSGECVFLMADGRCRIHPAAPFGCGYFDDHIPPDESEARKQAWLWACMNDREYQEQRAGLQHVAPTPETLRRQYMRT